MVNITGIISIIYVVKQYKKDKLRLSMEVISKFKTNIKEEMDIAEKNIKNFKYDERAKLAFQKNLKKLFPNHEDKNIRKFIENDDNMKYYIKRKSEFYATKHVFNLIEDWCIPIEREEVIDDLVYRETKDVFITFMNNHKNVLNDIDDSNIPLNACKNVLIKWNV